MLNPIYLNIAKLIERDSKSTTYKFALLRGVIDIIQEYSHSNYIFRNGECVRIPIGLLIEKWLIYYYPLLESDDKIPQINGANKLQFELQFLKIILYYKDKGGLSVFYNDFRKGNIPLDLRKDFIALAKKIQKTITEMPMKYIGQSIYKEYYTIFKLEKTNSVLEKTDNIDTQYLITNFGYFTIPLEYFDVFSFMGTFINGHESIIMKWADFSFIASKKSIKKEKVIEQLLSFPIKERDANETKRLFDSFANGIEELTCVWTGNKIREFDVDHVIPFSIWKNNDLWNLLPSDKRINNKKRDKIPSPNLIQDRKMSILRYWNLLFNHNKIRFQKEIEISLIGGKINDQWGEVGINNLKAKCNYLINNRGYEEWLY